MAEKNRKTFGDLLKDSLKEYKQVWKVFLIILILLSFIPSIIMTILQYFFDLSITKLGENFDPSLALPVFLKFYIPFLIIGLIVFILSIWMNSSFIYNSIYKKKEMSVKETLKGGRRYFWRFLGLSLIVGLILIAPGFMLGVIGGLLLFFNVSTVYMITYGIAFMIYIILIIWIFIYWLFSSYILIGENKKIIESLKLSKKLVYGKWWKTFGYMLLFIIIVVFAAVIILLISSLVNLGINPDYLGKSADIESNVYKINLAVSLIFNFIMSALITPFGVLFLKNFYLLRREERKK